MGVKHPRHYRSQRASRFSKRQQRLYAARQCCGIADVAREAGYGCGSCGGRQKIDETRPRRYRLPPAHPAGPEQRSATKPRCLLPCGRPLLHSGSFHLESTGVDGFTLFQRIPGRPKISAYSFVKSRDISRLRLPSRLARRSPSLWNGCATWRARSGWGKSDNCIWIYAQRRPRHGIIKPSSE